MKKDKRIMVLLLVTLVFLLCGCSKKVELNEYDTHLIARVEDNTYGVSELHRDKNGFEIFEVKDGEVVNTYSTSSALSLKEIIQLDAGEKPEDITKTAAIANYTWISDLTQSANYVKYLEDNGYSAIRKVSTQQFVDILMSNSVDIKRVLITSDTISVASVDYKELNIKNYFE